MVVGTLAEVTAFDEGVVDTVKDAGKAVIGAPGKAYRAVKRGIKKVGTAIDNKIDDAAAAVGKFDGKLAGKYDDWFGNKLKTYHKAYTDYYENSKKINKQAQDYDKNWNKQHAKYRKTAYK